MTTVTFDPAAFRELYPQFPPERISDARLHQAFAVACLFLDNSPASPVPVAARQALFPLLVCHVATLALREQDGQAGPVASAAQGSVKVNFALTSGRTGQAGEDYWRQTACGRTFWQAVRAHALGGRYTAWSEPHPWG